MTRIFYTDGAPEPEQPPEHHDPPLNYDPEIGPWLPVVYVVRQGCPDCHYPFDGDGWVLCDAHKEEE